LKSIHVSLALVSLVLIMTFASPVLGQANNSTYWFIQGLAFYNQDNYSASLDAYNKALELDQRDSEAWNNKGIDLGILGRYNDAIKAFENAVGLNESYAEAWYNMGVIYDLKGDPYTAVQAYKRATQINPSYQKALVNKNYNTDRLMARSLSCACQDQLALI
jgi:tetratricopeptide (TPR) repeat protein